MRVTLVGCHGDAAVAHSHGTGTFLFNCDYQRYYFKLFERTVSLWTHVNQPMELRQYLNPLYTPIMRVLRMTAHPLNIQPWMALFARWSLSRENIDEVNDIILFVPLRFRSLFIVGQLPGGPQRGC
jgi:hypothetical protein